MTFPARIGLVGLICCAAATASAQEAIYVNGTTGDDAWDGLCETWDGGTCGPKATIQAGIDAAVDGDEVVVANGTYTGDGNRDLDFGGRAITVRSTSGDPALCIIDCGGPHEHAHRGFNFHSGEDATSVLEGLMITNGYAGSCSFGGGVWCSGSSPTFADCAFSENSTSYAGGGMANCDNSNPTLTNCTFRGNSGYCGGGMCNFDNSNPTLTNCTFSENSAAWNGCGGGIYNAYNSSPTLTYCAFIANCGCGMYNEYSSPIIGNCTFTRNSVEGGASGMYNVCSNPTVTDCVFSENSSAANGTMWNTYSSPTVVNCTFSNNLDAGMFNMIYSSPTVANCTFGGNAGGMFNCEYSSPTVTSCTFARNVSSSGWVDAGMLNDGYCSPTLVDCTFTAHAGPAIACDSLSPDTPSIVTLVNCVLWNEGDEISNNDGSTISISYSDIQGGWDGEGNIDADPLFVDPDGPDDDPATWEDNDYHLAAGSPCIDAGDPEFVPLPGAADIDGEARLWDGDGDGVAIVDMGADEFGSFGVADLNCDGLLNAFDIDPFAKALAGINEDPPFASYDAAHPGCDPWLADCNADGALNAFDIDPFIWLLTGG